MATKLSNKLTAHLRDYLMCHEKDIYNGINEFGELRDIFIEIVGRIPEE